MNHIQISLAAARKNANMTQDAAAKALGVTQQTLLNWEMGRSEPTVSQGRAISKLYKMPLDMINFLPSK